ncbi:MAG: hypothetical protein IPK75_03375 [Acidobacteria bacterium]|nr:hypothetical protein [Acidobacteriota bacterium]
MPQAANDPVSALKTAISLRAAALAAFPAGAVLLALLERGWLAVGLLAAAMLGVSLFERRRIGAAVGIDIPSSPAMLVTGLIVRFGLLTGLFVVTVGVLALFRDTALSEGIGWPDLAVAAFSAGGAMVANAMSALLAPVRNEDGAPPSRKAPADAVILEGEIIDADPPA